MRCLLTFLMVKRSGYEMYYLVNDKEEIYNLANEKYSKDFMRKDNVYIKDLTEVMIAKGVMPDSIIWPKVSGINIVTAQGDNSLDLDP